MQKRKVMFVWFRVRNYKVVYRRAQVGLRLRIMDRCAPRAVFIGFVLFILKNQSCLGSFRGTFDSCRPIKKSIGIEIWKALHEACAVTTEVS